ncbi:transposase [Brucella tritici]|uniref:Transposase n=1 Tax=Brucella tritici TaxID=94626 RepID=A0A7X6JCK0_9HYPH|nr:transposase [Brucella tritici]MBJ6719714.1 transposase [Bacillus sp. PR5]NKW10677.1 transposase [Brucella tritici]
MTKRVPFTKEFEREAVRLAETSGRTRKELAEDVGIGLSTLTRWISRNRDATIDALELIDANEDMAAELKRLRRENEILRQERDILKKATVFSPRREVVLLQKFDWDGTWLTAGRNYAVRSC